MFVVLQGISGTGGLRFLLLEPAGGGRCRIRRGQLPGENQPHWLTGCDLRLFQLTSGCPLADLPASDLRLSSIEQESIWTIHTKIFLQAFFLTTAIKSSLCFGSSFVQLVQCLGTECVSVSCSNAYGTLTVKFQNQKWLWAFMNYSTLKYLYVHLCRK